MLTQLHNIPDKEILLLKNKIFIVCLAWTALVCLSAYFYYSKEKNTTIELAKKEAIATFNKDQAFRLWATKHGGVYVPISGETPPNPYLKHVQDRDIDTPSGKKLTLMNPAYMLRQVMNDYEKLYKIEGKITSLNPLNPINEPDDWERNALIMLQEGATEVTEFVKQKDEYLLRIIKPMKTIDGCLKCHAHQGYKIGDIRGGVGVSVPLTPYFEIESKIIRYILVAHLLFWLLGNTAIIFIYIRNKKSLIERKNFAGKIIQINKELEQRVEERTADLKTSNHKLQNALDEIKTLRGILPVCSYCKNIRDDKGEWNKIEVYISERSEAKFSHGICPNCFEKHYPEEFYDRS